MKMRENSAFFEVAMAVVHTRLRAVYGVAHTPAQRGYLSA